MSIRSDSTKVTFERVYTDMKEGLQALGETLKTGAEHVYEVLVRQQVVTSVSYLVAALIAIILVWIGVKNIKSVVYDKYGNPESNNLPKFLVAVIFTIIGGITGIICMCSINEIITGFVNPEYGAMKEIMEFVK